MLDLIRKLRSPQIGPAEFPFELQASPPPTIDLGIFTKGIDNIHVDVRLSPHFTSQAKHVLSCLLDQHVGRGGSGDKLGGPTVKEWEDFRASYYRMLETAIHRAKQQNQSTLVQLAQVGAVKFLLQEVQEELDKRRLTLKQAMTPEGGTTENVRIKLNERMSWLARNRSMIRYTINRQIMDQIYKAESGPVTLLRESILGEQYSVPQDFFLNPLLGAENPLDDEVLMKHYLILDHRSNDNCNFAALDGFLSQLFKTFPIQVPWPTDPLDIDTLFNQQPFRAEARKARDEKQKAIAERLEGHLELQQRLLALVEAGCREKKLLPKLLAAYEMIPCYSEYTGILNPQELHKFLARGPSRREILQKVEELQQNRGKSISSKPLQMAADRIANISKKDRYDYLARFLKDFATLHRDVTFYHVGHNAMDQIQLQDDPKNIRLSSANRTLHEFLAPNEEGAATLTIKSHVILKADVRGSNSVVAEIRKQGLNPASHFSLNFFNPITELLANYGAEKVFIEGDAVILSILEHKEVGGSRLSVARACALARRLLNLVRARNANFAKNNLPELELGIGLAYSNEPPAFLYDGDTQIMISSAIGKADRLSSCSWLLRKIRRPGPPGPTYVEVLEVPESEVELAEKGENYLRYNVNGIELEAEGFAKLKSEIVLQRLELRVNGYDGPMTLHTGTYLDFHGNLQRIVVREGIIRLFDRVHHGLGAKTATSFYEVVTDDSLLQKVSEALKSVKQDALTGTEKTRA
jgi:hypothetical protein